MFKEKENIVMVDTVAHASVEAAVLDISVGYPDFAGDSTLPPPPSLNPEQERKLWRKIDVRLMPMLAIMFLSAFLDRGSIGNAKLQGLENQLHLKGSQFNIALAVFFISYSLFEIPSNLLLKKIHPSRWLPAITMVWGIILMSTGFVKNFHQLALTRFLLGLAESGILAGIIYYLTFWYPRYKLQTRIGFFYGSASLAGAFSGLLAYGISFMSGTGGLLGWSWIFILEGLATVVVGFIALFVMVDLPTTAKFLTPQERAFVIYQKKLENSTVGEEEHLEMRHIWAALTDWQVWLQTLLGICVGAPLFGITLFLPSIIRSFGYSAAISQLLAVPPFTMATIAVYVNSYYSDKLRRRSPFILCGLSLAILGFFINLLKVPNVVKYISIFAIVTGTYGSTPGVLSWLGNNLSGQYKRGVGLALQIGLTNLSGIFSSNLYRNKDAPRYIFGNAISLMFVVIGFACTVIIEITYKRINRRRAVILQGLAERGQKLSPEEIKRLGDKTPTFRYVT
ncbi:hypothetical protein AX15_004776 [Amanita polypyramis BW_CC]|nr:hypothetical protein AX15_004776 [Amanita polypyramis BW_CC]